MYDVFSMDDRVGDVTAHINKYEPHLIASYMPPLDYGRSSLQNWAQPMRAINYELRATGTLTWADTGRGGRSIQITNGVDSKVRSVTATGAGHLHRGVTMEFYGRLNTWSGTTRRIVSATVGSRNLGILLSSTNLVSYGTVGVANMVQVIGPGSMADTFWHMIFAGTCGNAASMAYGYMKNMQTGECYYATASASNPAITTKNLTQIGIGDLSQTTQQENVNVMLFNYYHTYQSEQWARRRLGDPWGFISTRKRTAAIVPVAGGQPFAKRQGGVVHTLNGSRPFVQGFW